MARHVALLRAINVGGRVVKMDALRDAYASLGLTKVETFIASGNVIFESRAGAAVLERKLEAHLREVLGYEVATFVRRVPEHERFVFDGREIYWLTRAGIGQSKFSNAVFERIIKSPSTFRNVTTVRKLAGKYA